MIKINGMKTLTFFMLFAFVLTANIGVAFSQDQEVCPLSKGYWKTHPEWFPPDSDPLYEGGPTTYELMLMAPKTGNAFVMLFQQYVSLLLNLANHSCWPTNPEDADTLGDAFNSASDLLSKYIGMQTINIPKQSDDRALALQYAKLFDEYNNGYMCPDLCKCPCWTEENLSSLTASSCVQSEDNEFITVATVQNFTLNTSDSESPQCNVVDNNAMIGFALAINYTQFLDCREGLEMLIDDAGLMCSAP